MVDIDKVIKGVHDARRYLEDREWVDKSVGVHIDALNDALELLKEQKKLKEKLLRNIADNQLAVSPTGYETEEELAKRTGEWNGLQMAYEIVENDGN